MHAAVDIDDFTDGVPHRSDDQVDDSCSDVLGTAPAWHRREPLGELAVILPLTPAVISVAMTPGRTSLTRIPSGASRAAQSWVAIETPALEMQYSPRLKLTIVEEQEATLTIAPTIPSVVSVVPSPRWAMS